MNKKLPYQTPKDFSPITILGTAPNVLVAHPRGLSERRGRFETSACAFEE